MAILDILNEDFIKAFKEKNAIVKNALWNIKTQAVLLSKTQELTDSDVFAIIKRELKKIQATIDFEGIKEELKAQALEEKAVLEKYLPKKIGTDEIVASLKDAFDSWKVEKDMKNAIAFVKSTFGDAVEDMAEVAKFVKSALSTEDKNGK